MTKRREVPTLAFTIPEAAEAIRLSENTLRAWVKQGIVRIVRWQSLDLVPRVELDRLIVDALNNGGAPTVVSPPPSAVAAPSDHLLAPGVADDGAASGAGELVRAGGEAGDGRPSSEPGDPPRLVRSPAPTSKKARGVSAPRVP